MYAIELKNLWKKYRIGQPRTLTHAIPLFFSDRYQKEFLALKGINLQVKEGEKIGIIGPNGSGKSTLLQTIAGITTPTKGTVIVNGKVTALLGLGAGFHPELTGKDNIYLSGSILGMEAREITKRFDEIVEFSGIKKFGNSKFKFIKTKEERLNFGLIKIETNNKVTYYFSDLEKTYLDFLYFYKRKSSGEKIQT